ncbi:MAG: FAD-binding oxidoreductase [Beijerinckiaceae bacterium]|nr:FAD-binding oxidoreductase [Beijerinckiaceae bacterium]MCZ8300170.1 FAD-binding oxidoreductase [Beijerinckiaceae bacterium]
MPDIIVIGGGITGLATACALAGDGLGVSLLEARHLGAMASTWTLGGVRQSGRDPAELPLARAAVAQWAEWHEALGAETGYRRRGNLRLARNAEEAEAIRTMVAAQRALGLNLEFLEDIKAIRAIAPAIGDSVVAASFCPDDGHADPDMTLAALAGCARRRGVILQERMPALRLLVEAGRIIGVETPGGRLHADRVIVACGLHSASLLEPLGLALPMVAKRVCVLQTTSQPPSFEQVFGVANADCAGRQEIDGRFRVTTGIGDWQGDPARWTEAALRPSFADAGALIARTTAILPLLAASGLERVWGGLIDLTPDALPVFDAPADWPGLVIGAGFSGHGFGIGPVSGQILRALALGETSPFDLAPFRLGRFDPAAARAPLTLHG